MARHTKTTLGTARGRAKDPTTAQARIFLNTFRRKLDRMMVRGQIHIRQDEGSNIDQSGHVAVENVAKRPGIRAQVIADITRRMKTRARELRMWKLSATEQSILFKKLRAEMGRGKSSEPRVQE